MAEHIITIEDPSVLSLPPEFLQQLGLQSGSRVSISLEGQRMVIRPEPRVITETERLKAVALVDALAGSCPELAGAEDELYAERQRDGW